MAIPVLFKINNKHLIEIMLSSAELQAYKVKLDKDITDWTDEEILQCSLDAKVYPSEVTIDAEQYSKNAERTASYVLEELTLVNCKSKVTFVWNYLKAPYLQRLLNELEYTYDFEVNGTVYTKVPNVITVTYWDFTGLRTMNAYMGQTLNGNLVELDDYVSGYYQGKKLFWESMRIAFIER